MTQNLQSKPIQTKQKITRTNVNATNDQHYLFNICLCYYWLNTQNDSSLVLRLPQKRKSSTNHKITIELLTTNKGTLYDRNIQYKKKVSGIKKEIVYEKDSDLPIPHGQHPSNCKEVEKINRKDFSAIILKHLQQSELFEHTFDNFWKSYIKEEERDFFDFSQIVYLPDLVKSKSIGKHGKKDDIIHFVDKKDYLPEDGEIILNSFLEQFQSYEKSSSPSFVIISDSVEKQQLLQNEFNPKQNQNILCSLITRQEMISIIERNLIEKKYPSFMVDTKMKSNRNSTQRNYCSHQSEQSMEMIEMEKVLKSDTNSPTTSIVMSEENQQNFSVFQPCSKNSYTVYEGFDVPLIYFNPFNKWNN